MRSHLWFPLLTYAKNRWHWQYLQLDTWALLQWCQPFLAEPQPPWLEQLISFENSEPRHWPHICKHLQSRGWGWSRQLDSLRIDFSGNLIKIWVLFSAVLMADAQRTPSWTSGLHLSVFQDKSKRGAFNMFKEYAIKARISLHSFFLFSCWHNVTPFTLHAVLVYFQMNYELLLYF